MSARFDPHVIVELDGKRYDSWQTPGLITQVTIDLTTDKTSEATLTVKDDDFMFTDRHLTGDGMKPLEGRFWLGFGRDLGRSLFKGNLVGVDSDGATATFRFYDKGNKMKGEKKGRYHNRTTDLGVLRNLARERKLKFVIVGKVEEGELHDALMQAGQTDWEFAREVARRAGLRIWVRGDTLFVKEAAHVGDPVTTLAFGLDFRLLQGTHFSHKLPENRRGRPRRVELRLRGPGGSRLTGKSDESPRGTIDVEITEDLPTHTKEAANRRARAKKNSKREHAFEHTISMLPDYRGPRIEVQDTVEVVRAGKLYSGLHAVDRIHYDYSSDGLRVDLEIYRGIRSDA